MKIELILMGETADALAREVLRQLPPPFAGGRVVVSSLSLRPFRDARRQQVDARQLIEALGASEPGWIGIALTSEDLFLPVLAYLSGLAPLGGGRGVVSTARLDPGPERGARRLEIFNHRLVVEVAHEAGHAAGLIHCAVPRCVMHQSLSAEAMDLKDPAYCPACLKGLEPAASEVSADS